MKNDARYVLLVLGALGALACGLGWVAWNTRADLDTLTTANEGLDEEIAVLEKEIIQAPELARRLDACNVSFRDYVKILPSPEVATEEKLLTVVQRNCDAARIRLTEICCSKASNRTVSHAGEFQEVAVSFRVCGDYDSFVRFLNLLERQEEFVKVNAFAVTPTPALDLDASIELTTYKYIPTKNRGGS